MEDDDLNLDLNVKKKKKKAKPFDFGDLDETDSNSKNDSAKKENIKNDNKDNEIMEDLNDLTDFTGLKKKKKKKKPFNLDDLESALPTDDKNSPGDDSKTDESLKESNVHQQQPIGAAEPIVDDFDLDFTGTKKKKKKKKATYDQDEDDDKENDNAANVENDDDLKNDVTFSGSSSVGTVGQQAKWHDSDRDYTYDELLEMIYNKIKEKNPESETGGKKKYVLRPPQVIRIGTKKTSFANFLEICKSLHRQPKHLQAFLLTELGTNGSVDANNQLIIKGRFQQKQIESVLRKYIKEYVACQTCKSPETILQKETRLFFLQCESCGSRRSVANIKSGFQAVTGRRSNMRDKTT